MWGGEGGSPRKGSGFKQASRPAQFASGISSNIGVPPPARVGDGSHGSEGSRHDGDPQAKFPVRCYLPFLSIGRRLPRRTRP